MNSVDVVSIKNLCADWGVAHRISWNPMVGVKPQSWVGLMHNKSELINRGIIVNPAAMDGMLAVMARLKHSDNALDNKAYKAAYEIYSTGLNQKMAARALRIDPASVRRRLNRCYEFVYRNFYAAAKVDYEMKILLQGTC